MTVRWVDVPGFEGLYKVSSDGHVVGYKTAYRCGRKGATTKVLREREIIGESGRFGHRRVTLYKNKYKRRVFVHRLVAEAFIPNPDNKPEVDHINTIAADNRVENLRWVTHKENQNNPLTNKKQKEAQKGAKNFWFGKKGALHHASKKIICVETGVVYDGIAEAKRQTGICHIDSACGGRKYGRKTAGGFHWEYV